MTTVFCHLDPHAYEFGTGKSRLSMIIKTKIEFALISGHTSTLLSVNGLTNIPIRIRKNTRHVIIPRVENPMQSRCKVGGRDVGVFAEFVGGALGFPDYVITVDVKYIEESISDFKWAFKKLPKSIP